MTEEMIKETVNRRLLNPLIVTMAFVGLVQIFNHIVLDQGQVSPVVLVCTAICASSYIFQRVLIQLLVTKASSE